MIDQPKIVTKPIAEQTLVEQLRYRAAIRRKIRAEGDRLAAVLDAAADRIEELEWMRRELEK